MSKILEFLKANWKTLLLAGLKGVWTAAKSAAAPALIGAGVATLAGCGAMQTPSSKSQTSSIYAFGLPAVIITHDQKQVADNQGADENSAYQAK